MENTQSKQYLITLNAFSISKVGAIDKTYKNDFHVKKQKEETTKDEEEEKPKKTKTEAKKKESEDKLETPVKEEEPKTEKSVKSHISGKSNEVTKVEIPVEPAKTTSNEPPPVQPPPVQPPPVEATPPPSQPLLLEQTISSEPKKEE